MTCLRRLYSLQSRFNSRSLATGTVKWFNRPKGFGFIISDDDKADIFVHHTSIKSDGYRYLNDGERVQFDIAGPEDRRHAVNVTAEGGGPFIRENTYRPDLDFSTFSKDIDVDKLKEF